MSNILLTGPPGVGKTTIIQKIVEQLDCPKRGFYTEEMREDGRRKGFMLVTLDGKKAHLSGTDIESSHWVSHYAVCVENIDEIAVPAIIPAEFDELIVVDEIGKMECCSEKFRHTIVTALNAPNLLLGTIPMGGTGFIRALKNRDDVKIVPVTKKNRTNLPQILLEEIKPLLQQQHYPEKQLPGKEHIPPRHHPAQKYPEPATYE